MIRTNRRGIYPVGVELEESRSMTPKGLAARRSSTHRAAPRSSESVGADDHISPSRSALVGGFGCWNARRLCRRIRAGACGHAPLRNTPIPWGSMTTSTRREAPFRVFPGFGLVGGCIGLLPPNGCTHNPVRWDPCRGPYFLCAQKVSKDAPRRGKISISSPSLDP